MAQPYIVTLAQLAAMPLGTVVSHVKQAYPDHQMEFTCQGVLQMHPQARVVGNDGRWLRLRGLLPDIHIVEGRVVTHPDESSIAIDADWPHRFVVWPSKE